MRPSHLVLALSPLAPLVRCHSWQSRSFDLELPHLEQLSRRQDWTLTQPGLTGVAAMQLVVVSPTQALIVDKVQHNSMTINGHIAWSAIYSLVSNTARPVDLQTNSFCAGGSFLSNGTLVNLGGNTFAFTNQIPDANGAQGLRLFDAAGCPDNAPQCAFYESPKRIRLTSNRWYPTVVRLDDGSLLVIGGSKSGTFMNSAALNNPTLEFYPPKNLNGFNGTQIPSQFLNDTLNANLFAVAFLLPGGKVFVAANTQAMIYDWRSNVETRLPNIPNGVRITYPMAGTGALLPLSPSNNYAPTVMLCGGQTTDDHRVPASANMSSQDAASAQCASMELTPSGIAAGWQVETMPEARIMPDIVLLPTGKVLIVNGGQTGYSGYDNVAHLVGHSNADNPAFQPVLYDPSIPFNPASPGARFSHDGLPTSTIARLYHSVASLTPSGSIIIAGSSPNDDVSTVKYATDYRAEILSPPYMTMARPTFTGQPSNVLYNQPFTLNVSGANGTASVILMDFGYSTHALHMNMRTVELVSSQTGTSVSVTGPPDATTYPPGPGWLFVVVDGVPSEGKRVMVGNGASPPVDLAAWANMLARTPNP
ncbi:hypothetical protein AURDEDRAFT_86052 [Auricularia subglabra TFB-10046 SS5]|nr:hypothetical protein AURDEDRAFT_86052 [Auricularia subglabra TFB-10046 SS5]